MDVLLMHCAADRLVALQIAKELDKAGISCYMDEVGADDGIESPEKIGSSGIWSDAAIKK